MMYWLQKDIRLRPKERGFHLVTNEVLDQLPELAQYSIGLLHLFLKHTSASLSLNENADPDVRRDLAAFFRKQVPDNTSYFQHTIEGPDDMTAHVKAALIGVNLTLPIRDGRLRLGTWQGIYLGEHREIASSRILVATIQGQANSISSE